MATYNIREFYTPSWRTILTSNHAMWDERDGRILTRQCIAFLVEDANCPKYMISIEYTFMLVFGNLTPVKVGFSAEFVEKRITLAEAIKTAGAVRVRDGQETLDFGDTELRMHLNKKADDLRPFWILDIDIVDKKTYTGPDYKTIPKGW